MNSNDLARTKALAADLYEMQRILKRWANEIQALADENEQLRVQNVVPTQRHAPMLRDPTYVRTAPPVVMDVKEASAYLTRATSA
jgi:hypothetical protein